MEPSGDRPRSALAGEVLQNTYRIERCIGRGATGAVYEASHLRLVRRFAVKVLFPEVAQHPEAIARFQKEALVTSGLGHPHILEVVDFNHMEDGTPYIIMELLQGENLEDRIEHRGPLDVPQAAGIFGEAVSALAAAHEQGVVHRDLKPQNIFLCRWGKRDDFVKVLDFGLSKVLGGASMTRANSLMGTPAYMSPEQANAGAAEVDQRTDVYAMGAILFEMLTGQPPFQGLSLPKLLQSIVHAPPPTLRSLRADLPGSLEPVVARALHKDRDQRFRSVKDFWAGLTQALQTAGWQVPDLDAMTDRPDQSVPRIKPVSTSPEAFARTLPPDGPNEKPAPHRTSTLSSSVGEVAAPVAPGRRRLPRGVLVFAVLLALSAGLFTVYLVGKKPVLEERRPTPVAPRTVLVAPQPATVPAPQPDAGPDHAVVAPVLPPDASGPDLKVRHRPRHRPPRPPGVLKVSTLYNGEPVVVRVIVDGKSVGESPVYQPDVRAGPHRVTVTAPGFRPVTRRVVIRPGEKASIVLQLRRQP